MSDQVDVEEAKAWLRSRPRRLWALMFHLPPTCLVRANKPLMCPAPGAVGVVISYTEHEDGDHGVRVHVDGCPVQGECDPSWLEVVGYQGPFTPAFVARTLGMFS